MLRASGAKYAALADVPGFSTSTFFALRGPISRMPTLLYFAGVPGAAKPSIRSKRADAGAAVKPIAITATAAPIRPSRESTSEAADVTHGEAEGACRSAAATLRAAARASERAMDVYLADTFNPSTLRGPWVKTQNRRPK